MIRLGRLGKGRDIKLLHPGIDHDYLKWKRLHAMCLRHRQQGRDGQYWDTQTQRHALGYPTGNTQARKPAWSLTKGNGRELMPGKLCLEQKLINQRQHMLGMLAATLVQSLVNVLMPALVDHQQGHAQSGCGRLQS